MSLKREFMKILINPRGIGAPGGVGSWSQDFINAFSAIEEFRFLKYPLSNSKGMASRASELCFSQISMPKESILFSLCNWGPILRNHAIVIHDIAPLLYPDYFSWSYAASSRFILPRIAREAKIVFTVSGLVRTQLVEYLDLNPDKVIAIGSGIPSQIKYQQNEIKQSIGLKKDSYFMFIGGHDKRKNLQFLLNIWPEIYRLKKYRLKVVSSTKTRVFHDSHLINVPGVDYYLDVSSANYRQLISCARALLTPSIYEGFNLPIVEFMELSKPVLASRTGIAEEVVNKGVQIMPLDEEVWLSTIIDDKLTPTVPSGFEWADVAKSAKIQFDLAFNR